MDIITFGQQVHERIRAITTDTTTEDNVVRKGKALNAIRNFIRELKQFTITYQFKDAAEEIQFFKEVKPVIVSQYIYYKRVYNLALFDSFRDHKQRIENYHHMLQKMRSFASKYESFYEYCMAGSTFLDDQYFRRNSGTQAGIHEEEKFTTRYDKLLGKILAHEMIKEHLLHSIHREQDDHSNEQLPRLQWTASKIALVELVYAWHASKAVNYGKADIRQIAQSCERMFGVDLSNHVRIFSDIKLRKSGYSTFLDQLRADLSNLINDSL